METIPAFPIPGVHPPGNWIARHIRLSHDNSKESFPDTPDHERSRLGRADKFTSLYTLDYPSLPIHLFLDNIKERGKQPKRPTIRDVLFGHSPTQIFQDWRIPKSITSLSSEDLESRGNLKALVTSRREKSGGIDKLQRQSTLPVLVSPRHKSLLKSAPVTLRRSQSTAGQSIDRSQTAASKKEQYKQETEYTDLRGETEENTTEEAAGDEEEEEKLLLRRFPQQCSFQTPRSTTAVFRSQTPERMSNNVPRSADPVKRTGKESKLKFVKLLDPQTRANREMYTTWHHLPDNLQYKRVSDTSSHFTMPKAPTPRHFVIHPDWG